MLDVTIYKTTHIGEQEARKLIDPIGQSNAFAIEATCTADCALLMEADWSKLLESGMSRTRFLQKLDVILSQENSYPLIKEYLTKLHDYLFRNKCPIYYTERFGSPEDVQNLHELAVGGNKIFYNGIELIVQGCRDTGIQTSYDGARMQAEAVREKDRNIARNLETAEEVLRRTYPKLAQKGPIKLGIQIGRIHRPEEYCSFPVTVESMVGELSPRYLLLDRIDNMAIDGAPIYEMAPLFMEFASIGR